MKTDLNLKIASKELMRCLDDQCITFTLRSRKGAFTSVMRAKRRHKWLLSYLINLVFLKNKFLGKEFSIVNIFQMSSTPTTTTATTTITTKKDKNEEQFELEQQFVLRMPAVILLIQALNFLYIDLFLGRLCNTFTWFSWIRWWENSRPAFYWCQSRN